MPITPELLRRLSSLDDLLEFVAALGYTGGGEELGAAARERLGLGGPSIGVQRAAILGRHGPFRVYGLQLDHASRAAVALCAERLGRATPGEQHLLLALDRRGATLAVAALSPAGSGFTARQFRVSLAQPSPAAAEILSGLTPRKNEGALALAVRLADVLIEEGLTRRFFREFARLHARAAEQVADMPRATATERRDFALVVLTRVLFLYFVQAKGWLAGRSDFLPSAFDTALGRRGHLFHRTVFEPLCFGALSVPPAARSRAARALGELPFLNGGLFERHALERRFPGAHLPDETWRDLFDELFERFHFTVRERDDQDAVDPEMLGRVFEGLMAPDRRKASGTYFTPPDLLRRTVSAALTAALNGSGAATLRTLRVLDPAVGSGAFLLEALLQLERRRAETVTREDARTRRRAILRDNLFGVDVDPMAVRLAELRLWLALVADDAATLEQVAPLPNLDQNLRQGDSLLSPLDLARTASATVRAPRLMRVAEQRAQYFAATGREKANIARAIRAGERASAAETTDAAIASLTARLADAAAGAGRDLFGDRRRRSAAQSRQVAAWRLQRRELLAVRRRIATDEALPFFAYDVHFADALAAGGFDVVLGNPPWVRGERLPASQRIALARQYESFRAATAHGGGFAHLPDLSVAFVERALTLARPGGVVAFVVPAKLLRAGYAGPLRALVRRTATVECLEDRAHGGGSGFAATVFPSIWVLRRRRAQPADPADPANPAAVRLTGASGDVLCGQARQDQLALASAHPAAPWTALPGPMVEALRAAFAAGPCLAGVFRPLLGVKTGANDVFLRPLFRAVELPAELRVPAVLGRDVSPFAVAPSCAMLAAVDEHGRPLERVPESVAEYLRPYAGMLRRRADGRTAPPWTVFRTELLAARWLVIWRDIAGRLEAAALHRPHAAAPVPLNTCYGVSVPDRRTADWLAAWLNSLPARAMAAALAERASGGAFRFSAATVGALPLPADPRADPARGLADLGAAAANGEEWNQDDLDTLAVRALGLDAATAAALRDLGDALRRNADRHR